MMTDRHESHPPSASPDAETLAAFGRISAELLHDLAGVLSTLSGRVAVARDEADRGRSAGEELVRIQKDTEDLRRMITEILQVLRGDPRSPEVSFELRASVEETIDRWVHSAPSVTTTLRGSLGRDAQVAGPRSFFSRALWNLLRNAGRHARSRIRLTLDPVPGTGDAEFLIEDDGDGLDEALLDRLFRPFTSGTPDGLGLGLSFSRWALDRLGGTLEYTGRSEKLGGACFRMTVPLVQRRGSATLRKSWPPRGTRLPDDAPLRGLRLALVDDEPALLSVLARVLGRAGAEVREIPATGSGSAASIVEALCASEADVILLDLNLGAFSGLEVLRILGEGRPELHDRVLLLTGGSPPDPPPTRPVVHKLAEWDELFSQIRRAAD